MRFVSGKSCIILAKQYLVPDQARQHIQPVCAWIHSFHELDKLTPRGYQEQVSACCYPHVLPSHCNQSISLLGSSNELI